MMSSAVKGADAIGVATLAPSRVRPARWRRTDLQSPAYHKSGPVTAPAASSARIARSRLITGRMLGRLTLTTTDVPS